LFISSIKVKCVDGKLIAGADPDALGLGDFKKYEWTSLTEDDEFEKLGKEVGNSLEEEEGGVNPEQAKKFCGDNETCLKGAKKGCNAGAEKHERFKKENCDDFLK
jgi:hypothetical protein